VTITEDLEHFTGAHCSHGGRLIAKTGELTPNGHRLMIAWPCGVTFERWITPEEAVQDIAVLRLN
jgi:hypothetical protein